MPLFLCFRGGAVRFSFFSSACLAKHVFFCGLCLLVIILNYPKKKKKQGSCQHNGKHRTRSSSMQKSTPTVGKNPICSNIVLIK